MSSIYLLPYSFSFVTLDLAFLCFCYSKMPCIHFHLCFVLYCYLFFEYMYLCPCVYGKWRVCGVVGAGETKAAHDADKSHGGSEES